MKNAIMRCVLCMLPLLLWSCGSTKHVPDGKFLLDNVVVKVSDPENGVKNTELTKYVRQMPNHRVLWGVKLQLAMYNLSGKDSTKWYNKWLRRVGNPPVIYDNTLAESSVTQIRNALVNKGYMEAKVSFDTVHTKPKKLDVKYSVTLHHPHYISSIDYNIYDDTLRNLILADSAQFLVRKGDPLDRSVLDEQRRAIAERLQNKGYYAFTKDYITFTADTAANEKDVNLTMNLMKPYKNDKMPYYTSHRKFYIRNVLIDTNYDPADAYVPSDTITWKGMRIISRAAHYLDEKDVEECCFIKPGKQYKSQNVNRTYQAFGRWDVLKFVNIELTPVGEFDGKVWLDAFVMLTKTKTHNVSLSLEGTNSEGDLGFGVGLGYQHRNLFGGSEAFRAKFRANYESISGDLSGLINDNYSEYSIETGIKFPKFKAPFLKERFKRKILASTELAVNFNYQTRPEYTRIIFGAGWKYIWSPRRKSERHTFSLIDVNYVYLPYSKNGFLDQITNPLLRYSYENHLIMRIGYNLYMSNKPSASTKKVFIPNVYTLRAGVETSGNLLYAISNIIRQKRSDGGYKVFGTRYAQYVKLDADYSLTHYFSERGSLAFHVGGGVVVPYGNSSVAPFEKRFYAGGANGVRGWAVRTLGPGCYNSSNTVNSFIYQCGDIRMDMNLEFRAKLFWVIEMAAFVDAGNIWTMREYDDQVGGVFKFNTFYKQIAMAYGLGIRLNFNYFLLRFDLGMKAHNPAIGQEEWPLVHPNWKRDSQFHFSVGYPF